MKTKEQKDSQDTYNYSSTIGELEEENRILKETLMNLRNEIDRFKYPPLMVCEMKEYLEKDTAIIRVPNGNEFCVKVSRDAGKLFPSDTILCEQKNLTVLRKINSSKKFNVDQFIIVEKPEIKWEEVGGLTNQIREIQEVIELPLLEPELFKKIGITPPKGILLYGPPGTGKTLLAKAVATSTNSTFIEVVGSELVQKFIGEGAKLVKEMFQLAKEKAPAIIFIDEIDSLAGKRIEMGTSGEREVQRTFMQLLAEIDGFNNLDNVKIIGCTNRKDILDPAILRPGRLDRILFVDNPDHEGIKSIFKIHSKNMNLDPNINVDKIAKLMEGFSGAKIKSACTEAGYLILRKDDVKKLNEQFKETDKKYNGIQTEVQKIDSELQKIIMRYKKLDDENNSFSKKNLEISKELEEFGDKKNIAKLIAKVPKESQEDKKKEIDTKISILSNQKSILLDEIRIREEEKKKLVREKDEKIKSLSTLEEKESKIIREKEKIDSEINSKIVINESHFREAIEKVKKEEENESTDFMEMFG